jgi:hypothetical protein
MNRLLPWLFVLGFVAGPLVVLARRLLEEIPPQTVVRCEHSQTDRGQRTTVTLSGGAALDVTSMLDRPDACLPAGTSIEKPRWTVHTRVGATDKDWPLGLLLAMLGAGVVVGGALLVKRPT